MIRLYDTATQEVRELELREPGRVSVYLCGPTVYAPPHLGHGRATLVYDTAAVVDAAARESSQHS